MFSMNSGQDDDGMVNHAKKLYAAGMSGPACMAEMDLETLLTLSDDHRSMARRCLVCIVPNDLDLVPVQTSATGGQSERAQERLARRKAFEQAQAANADDK